MGKILHHQPQACVIIVDEAMREMEVSVDVQTEKKASLAVIIRNE